MGSSGFDSDSPESDGPNPCKDLLEAEEIQEASSSWSYVKSSESVNGLPDQLPILLASNQLPMISMSAADQLPTISLSAAVSSGEITYSLRSPASESRQESETVGTNTASEIATMSQTLNLSTASETVTMNPTLSATSISSEENIPVQAAGQLVRINPSEYRSTLQLSTTRKKARRSWPSNVKDTQWLSYERSQTGKRLLEMVS